MKKLVTLFLLSLLFLHAFAQNVGIGLTNPTAKLHVAGGLKVDTLSGQGKGILMHDNNGSVYSLPFPLDPNKVLTGDGTFKPVLIGWQTSGNVGTNSNAFIGTADDAIFRFMLNNKPAGLLDHNNTNTSLGYLSFYKNSNQAVNNTAFGAQALQDNAQGKFNTAVGFSALNKNISGLDNNAIGDNALFSNVSGNYNNACRPILTASPKSKRAHRSKSSFFIETRGKIFYNSIFYG